MLQPSTGHVQDLFRALLLCRYTHNAALALLARGQENFELVAGQLCQTSVPDEGWGRGMGG